MDRNNKNPIQEILGIVDGVLIGGFASTIALPIIWFISGRTPLGGLILTIFLPLFGVIAGLMYLGGLTFGAIVGATSTWAVTSERNTRKVIIFGGAVGGALTGLCSSLIFFPMMLIVGSS